MLEYKHNWYIENKEHCSQLRKKWREDNPDKYFNSNAKRRFNEDTQGNGITKEQWYECFNFFNWECAYSGIQLDKDNRIIQLDVFLNWELESLILSYGDDIEVIEPISLRERIQKRVKNLLEIYNCAE